MATCAAVSAPGWRSVADQHPQDLGESWEKVPKCTNSGAPAKLGAAASVPDAAKRADGQHVDHWVLCDEEREKGFVRPVRTSYRHLKCGTVTTMPLKIAETYAARPSFYGQTFCCGCGEYLPVGEHGEFAWLDGTKVGT